MFFDDHPHFLKTSSTASNRQRLNMRHAAIFTFNKRIFRRARVLDIASHDGRWTMAALRMGAAHATGIEVSTELVKKAEETFTSYAVDPATYRFIHDDVFDVLADPAGHELDVDVVMCLGFLYHTLRYQELFAGVRALQPKHFLVDTAVIVSDEPLIKLHLEDTSKESAGDDHSFALDGQLITGRPSVPALEMMLQTYGFRVVNRFDWAALIDKRHPDEVRTVESYRARRRVTWLCAPA